MAKICQAKDSFKGGINGIKLWLCQRSIQIFFLKRGSCYQMVVVYFGDIFVGNREWLLDVVFF